MQSRLLAFYILVIVCLSAFNVVAQDNVFPEQFKSSWQNCNSDVAQFQNGWQTVTATIVGKENDRCHIKFYGFDLYIPLEVLPKANNIDDLAEALKYPEVAVYDHKAAYKPDGILFGLANCAKGQSDKSAYIIKNIGEISIKNENIFNFSGNMCYVHLGNELTVAGKLRDYSIDCNLNSNDVQSLIAPEKTVIDLYAPQDIQGEDMMLYQSGVINEQTVAADEALLNKLLNQDYCRKNANITQNTPSPATTSAEPKNEVEEYVPAEVFSPRFMMGLRKCQPSSEVKPPHKAAVLGMDKGVCLVRYDGFDLRIPPAVLANINNFDDLQVLLKNKDITTFNYKPEYNYKGLMYAVEACHKKVDYYSEREQKKNNGFEIVRGLRSMYINDICTINLDNKLYIDGSMRDYSVQCQLPAKVLDEIRPYFEDLLKKYGARRRIGAKGRILVNDEEFNEKTREADDALMYYMQQNGYCQQADPNNPFE